MASKSKRGSLTSQVSIWDSPKMQAEFAAQRPTLSTQGSVPGSPKNQVKFSELRHASISSRAGSVASPRHASISSQAGSVVSPRHGSVSTSQAGSPNMGMKSASTRPSVSSQSSVYSSLCSSVEDLSFSVDSLDLLCVDNVQSEDEIQTVLYRLLMDMEKLKKKSELFQKELRQTGEKERNFGASKQRLARTHRQTPVRHRPPVQRKRAFERQIEEIARFQNSRRLPIATSRRRTVRLS